VSSNRRSTEKRPYEAPVLSDLGSVIDLTRGAGLNPPDNATVSTGTP